MITRIEYQSKDGTRQATIERRSAYWTLFRYEAMRMPQMRFLHRARFAPTLTKAQALARKWVSR